MGEGAARSGVIAVDKPTGLTSHDVVRHVRRALNTRRVGHCGTLDPLATGLLLVCVGRMTRLSDWLTGADKQYESTFRLGARSDSADADGTIEAVENPPVPARDEVEAAVARWTGAIDQIPPVHSAIRVGGVRSYELARRNQAADLPSRPVTVKRFDVVEYDYPRLRVVVDCTKGTYIRSLARDVGDELGCGGYVEALRRTRIGRVGIDEAVRLDVLEGCDDVDALWIDPVHAVDDLLQPLELALEGARDFTHGRAVEVDVAPGGADRTTDVAVCHGQRLIGVGRVARRLLQPVRVFADPLAT